MRRIAVLVAVAGCATRTVQVAPGVIAGGAPDLHTYGHAKVYAEDGKVTEIHAKDSVEVHVRQEGELQIPMKLTLGEMAAGCEVDHGDCIAWRVVDQRVVVAHDHHLDSDRVAKAVGFGAVGGLIGFCLSECQDEGSVGRAIGYTAIGIGAFGLLVIAAIALGGHD